MTVLRVLVLASLLSACSSDSGILVSISGTYSVDQLQFQVGVLKQGKYFLDSEASGKVRNVKGRNLRSDPYEELLMEQEQGATPPRIRVVVLGLVKGKITYFDVMDPSQPFVRGEVVRRALTLRRINSSASITMHKSGCFSMSRVISSKTHSWQLLTDPDDLDCDGHKRQGSPADCDDSDPSVHPGAAEICDGKDNNCDKKYAASSIPCYATEGGECRKGRRACGDATGTGWAKTCEATAADPAFPGVYCVAYDACSSGDLFKCADEKVKRHSASCTLEADASGLCPGSVKLTSPVSGSDSCTWKIFDDASYPLSLSSATGCSPKLQVSAGTPPGPGKVALEFSADQGKTLALIEITMSTSTVTTCSAEPVTCSY